MWQEAKEMLMKSEFPDKQMEELVVSKGLSIVKDEYHNVGKDENHNMETYRKDFKFEGFPYMVDYKYQYCPECKVIMRKQATLLNNKENLAFTHVFYKYND